MSEVLARWNGLPQEEAVLQILPCCGSKSWAATMASKRPLHEEAALLAASDETWRGLGKTDWLEAFESHPRIGEMPAAGAAGAQSSSWSAQEQQKVSTPDEALRMALKWGNREYEQSSGGFLLFARRKNRPAKSWRFCAAGCTMMRQPNSARRLRSSVKSCTSA